MPLDPLRIRQLEATVKGPEARASEKQLWRLNTLDGAMNEALVRSFGEQRSYVTWDAAFAVLAQRRADGQF